MRVARVFQHWCSRRKVALFVAEQGAVAAAFVAAFVAVARPPASAGLAAALALAAVGAFAASFYFADLYDLRAALQDRPVGVRLLAGLAAASLVASPLAFVGRDGSVLAGLGAAIVAALATRALLPRLVGAPERVLVVGAGPRARSFARMLAQESEIGLEVAGLLDVAARGTPVAAHLTGEADEVAQRLGARIVAVALESEVPPPAEALLRCRLRGIEVMDATALAERAMRRLPVTWLRAEELMYAEGFSGRRLDEIGKRALDLVAALGLATLAAPLMLLAAILVKLDSPGPVLYRQERVGKGGRIFWLTKFRTMRTDAEADGRPMWAQVGDARVTRVGRLLRKARVDELPQILSVLKGDMSFVGPRPERPFFVERIKTQVPFFGLREGVKPGITGWAQLRYPYGASVDDARAKLEYDLYYLKNRSLFLDLTILFHTVRHVLMGRGAR